MIHSGIPCEGGILYGPTKSGKMYKSVYYHRQINRSPNKCIWSTSISPVDEYGMFGEADDKNWQDTEGHYWGVCNRGDTPIGTRGERICKFPRTSNPQDPWHGYPVGRSKDTPSDDFVEGWIKDGIISRQNGRAIQKGKL